jgi:hypothetical protein
MAKGSNNTRNRVERGFSAARLTDKAVNRLMGHDCSFTSLMTRPVGLPCALEVCERSSRP